MSTEQNYVGRGTIATPTPQTPLPNPSAAKNGPESSAEADNRPAFLVHPVTGETTELWKPIPDLEGFYQVSNLGRIRNLQTGTFTPLRADKEGHFILLSHPVSRKLICVKLHRVVATLFIPNPKGYEWVIRKDKNKLHNWASNLEWRPARKKLITSSISFSDFILDRLQQEGRISQVERQQAGIVSAQDDSMSPTIGQGARFVASPVNPVDYTSLVGKVVAVVVKAKLFAYYLGRVVSITDEAVHVSRDNSEWSDRIESRSVIASIAKVVSVLETWVN